MEKISGRNLRSAVFLGALAVMGVPKQAPAKSPLPPLCHGLAGHQTPDGSVRLKGEEEGKVVCLVDGDTFDVRLRRTGEMVRARIWGVDCPESSPNGKCMEQGVAACAEENVRGKEVTQTVRAFFAADSHVFLEPPYKANGDRKLAYLRLKNGVDLGRALIEKCLCAAGYKHNREAQYEKAAEACDD